MTMRFKIIKQQFTLAKEMQSIMKGRTYNEKMKQVNKIKNRRN